MYISLLWNTNYTVILNARKNILQILFCSTVSFKSGVSFIQTIQTFQSKLKLDIPEELIE